MNKLIASYRASPSFKLAQKIRAYERKHMMSITLLSREDQDLVRTAIHHANTPQETRIDATRVAGIDSTKVTPEKIQSALEARFPGLKGKIIVC